MYYLIDDTKEEMRIIDSFDDFNRLRNYISNTDEVVASNKNIDTIDDVLNKLKDGIVTLNGIIQFGDDTILIDSNHNHIQTDGGDIISTEMFNKYRNKVRELVINKLLKDETR